MRILVAEAEIGVADEVCRLAMRHVAVARLTLAEVQALGVPAPDVVGLVIGAIGDEALNIVRCLRRSSPRLPILILHREIDGLVVNLAQALRCELVSVPFGAGNILGFVEDSLERFVFGRTLRSRNEGLMDAYSFSRREREMMEACVFYSAPRDVCAELGISYSTYRTMRARMLRKSGVDSFESLCALFRGHAVGSHVLAEISRWDALAGGDRAPVLS